MKRNWDDKKCKLKLKFALLMDNKLLFEENRKEEIIKNLQIKLGKTKEELNKIISAI
jgi:hypothetical protein